jgi:putative tryptophan/tyrosine transport system substrate-binding protein
MDFVPESDPATPARVGAFREGMEKQGWVLGRNLAIDYRWSIFDMERARATAEELLNLAPDVMFCAGSPATLALQRATRTVRLCSSPSPTGLPRHRCELFASGR